VNKLLPEPEFMSEEDCAGMARLNLPSEGLNIILTSKKGDVSLDQNLLPHKRLGSQSVPISENKGVEPGDATLAKIEKMYHLESQPTGVKEDRRMRNVPLEAMSSLEELRAGMMAVESASCRIDANIRLANELSAHESGRKALILYADSMLAKDSVIELDDLKPGAVLDIEDAFRKANILDNATIIVYARKDTSAAILKDVLDRIAGKAGKKINIVTLTASELETATQFDEAAEFEKVVKQIRAKFGINNGMLLGAVKGQTMDAEGLAAKAAQDDMRVPVVTFKSGDGIYSFSVALAAILRIRNDRSPDKKWLIILDPIMEISKEFSEAYEHYIKLRQELEAQA
jgi:hypothetical protein